MVITLERKDALRARVALEAQGCQVQLKVSADTSTTTGQAVICDNNNKR